MLRVNQRGAERTPRRSRIEVVRTDPPGPVEAVLKDISADGLGFDTPAALAPGEVVRVRVALDPVGLASQRAATFAADAEVRRVEAQGEDGPHRVGVRFLRVERTEREKWTAFVGRNRSTLF